MVATMFGRASTALCWILVLLLQGSQSSLAFSSQPLTRINSVRVATITPQVIPHQSSFSSSQKRLATFQLGASYGQNAFVRRMSDFKSGAILVHQRFWDLCVKIYGRALVATLAVSGVAGLLYWFAPKLSVSLVAALHALLVAVVGIVRKPANYLGPVKKYWSKGVSKIPQDTLDSTFNKALGVPLVGMAVWLTRLLPKMPMSRGAKPSYFTSSFGQTLFDQGLPALARDPILLHVLLAAPLVEEFLFRLILLPVLKKILKRGSESSSLTTSYLEVLEEKREEMSPWAITTSALFAAVHLVAWAEPLAATSRIYDGEGIIQALTVIFACMTQSYAAFVLSIRKFSPLMETKGVFASIGASVMWNVSILTSMVGLPIRGARKVILRMKNGYWP